MWYIMVSKNNKGKREEGVFCSETEQKETPVWFAGLPHPCLFFKMLLLFGHGQPLKSYERVRRGKTV